MMPPVHTDGQVVARLALATSLPWPLWLGLAGVLGALAARAAWAAWPRPYGKALALLRMLSAAGLLALVLQPEWITEQLAWHKPHVAVLVDTSASMAAAPDPTGSTRLASAQQWAQSALDGARGPKATRTVSVHTVGSATDTDLLAGLGEVLKGDGAGRPPDAVVLLSDGGDNVQLNPQGADARATFQLPAEAAQKLAALAAPVSTLAQGAQAPLCDVALAKVQFDPYGFVKNTLHVDVTVRIEGYSPGLPLHVTLRGDEGIVAQEKLTALGQEAHVRLSFVPKTVGEFVYRVEVAPSPGEATLSNNRFAFITQVVRDKIRVLHVAGRPSWDQRFLREALRAQNGVDLISFYILRTPYSDNAVPESELALIPFPVERLFTSELQNFDVVLFQNFDFRPFRMEGYLPNLARAIEEGLGFMMLGGQGSLGQAGYGGTALEAQLPTGVGGPSLEPGPAPMAATAAGRSHPLLALCGGQGEPTACLESLPKLTNINPLGSAHPDAVVLAEALVPGDAPPRRLPLLVAREPGRGRTLTLATDALWHWRVHQGPTSTAARAYDRFWQQALLWLTHDPATAALKLSVSGQGVAEGPLEVVATLPQPTGPDAPSGAMQVHLDLEAVGETPAGLDGAPRLATVQPDGRATFQLPALPPGAYRLTARAGPPASRPQELTAQAHVVVQPQGPELTHLAVQPALLQAVSAATGGQVLPPDAPSTVVERVPVALAQPPIVLGRRRLPLWDNGYALILVLSTLTLEWWARRRVGLP